MGFLGDLATVVGNAGQAIGNFVVGAVEDIASWGAGLVNEVGAALTAEFGDDVIGINANGVNDMIDSIESYISEINSHLDQIKSDTDTSKAMSGEYADAVRAYVGVACDVCYKITSRLRYFEDKLILVRDAYKEKDTKLASTINDTATEMNNKWDEYKRQY